MAVFNLMADIPNIKNPEIAEIFPPQFEQRKTTDGQQIRVTTAESRDTLPRVGYTVDQLINYIYRSLGAPVFNIELTPQQIADAIQDALSLYSQYKPQYRYGAITLVHDKYTYLEGVDCGQGVANCTFVDSVPAPTEIFYGNLISPAPLLTRGMDDYDTWLRWRKTWMRVTSVQPNWLWDDYRKVLFIHNPIERYNAAVLCLFGWDRTESLSEHGARWVKEYARAKAQYILGEIYAKFSGAIPGPVKDIQLDSSKREKAEAVMEKLEQELKNSQDFMPLTID